MNYTLSLIFVSTSGDKVTISITGVKPGVTQAETSALMDTFIAKDIFATKGGSLVSKYGAQLTERTVTKFTV
jgi:hypothetical protein